MCKKGNERIIHTTSTLSPSVVRHVYAHAKSIIIFRGDPYGLSFFSGTVSSTWNQEVLFSHQRCPPDGVHCLGIRTAAKSPACRMSAQQKFRTVWNKERIKIAPPAGVAWKCHLESKRISTFVSIHSSIIWTTGISQPPVERYQKRRGMLRHKNSVSPAYQVDSSARLFNFKMSGNFTKVEGPLWGVRSVQSINSRGQPDQTVDGGCHGGVSAAIF